MRWVAMRIVHCSVAFIISMFAVGCAYRTPEVHVPASMPALDPGAITVHEISVVDGVGDPVSETVAADVADDAADILEDAANECGSRTDPGRVRMHVVLEESWVFPVREMGTGTLFAFGGLAGMQIDHQTLSIELEVDSGGRTFRGRGAAAIGGSLYAPARRRALALAIDRALAQASADP
jgi:hypothetical protein